MQSAKLVGAALGESVPLLWLQSAGGLPFVALGASTLWKSFART
jgi:hypothetical protein